MVTFAGEQVVSARRVEKRYDVSDDTLRRWFDEGLEKVQRGRKVFTSLEALDRFFGTSQRSSRSSRLSEAMKALESTSDKERMDGKSERTQAGA